MPASEPIPWTEDSFCRGKLRSNQLEYVNYQNPYKKEQRNGAEQHMTDIIFPIFVAMSQRVICDKTGYQQKYPVDHRLRLWFMGGSVLPCYGSPSFHLTTPLQAF